MPKAAPFFIRCPPPRSGGLCELVSFAGRGWSQGRRPATERAGMPGLHFHELRHTFATLALESGAIDMHELSRAMGRASYAITDDVYAHLRRKDYSAHRARFSAHVAAAGAAPLPPARIRRWTRSTHVDVYPDDPAVVLFRIHGIHAVTPRGGEGNTGSRVAQPVGELAMPSSERGVAGTVI